MASIDGTSGNDTLNGTVDGDTINGFAGDDTINGLEGTDIIYGGDGNDIIDGGTDDDHIYGGDGDDTIYGGSGDNGTVGDYIEDGPGNDTVYAGPDQDVIIGSAGNDYYDGGIGETIGIDLDSVIYASALAGIHVDMRLSSAQVTSLDGNDVAGIGTDTLINIEGITGSAFGDVMIAGDSGMGLRGLAGNDVLTGGAGWDTLTGDEGDDLLSGGGGDDSLNGGDGNDTASYENAASGVTVSLGATPSGWSTMEGVPQATGGAGTDTLTSIENLIGSSFNDVLSGAASGSVLDGRGGSDVLQGGTGSDVLIGGAGLDILKGGYGNDLYIISTGSEHSGSEIQDLGFDSDVDEVRFTSITPGDTLTLFAGDSGIERISIGIGTGTTALPFATTSLNVDASALQNGVTIVGNNGDNNLVGTDFDDTLQGRSGNDSLYGRGGNDTLQGSLGVDHMEGGVGDDTYRADSSDVLVENAGEGTDTVISAQSFTLGDNFENLTLGITVTDGGEEVLVRTGRGNELDNQIAGTHQDDILYGMAGNDMLTGINGNDYFDGGIGADTMIGGLGADTYVVDNVGDLIQGEVVSNDYPGDTVISSISYDIYDTGIENLTLTGSENLSANGNERDNVITGNSGDNLLTGYFGNDILFGGAGNDSLDGGNDTDAMHGGLGDDVYYVDTGADTVIENAGEGIDRVYSTVSYGLGANVEMLFLTGDIAIDGTGNALDNSLVGNSEANVLNGASGADMMWGGLGDDTYYVDNAGDVPIENPGEGRDRVYSSVSYTLGANMEILALLGSSAINAAGNGLANTLIGNSAANVLNGAGGADSMLGGAGDDTYYVDNIGDIVAESASAGRDRVYSSVSYALGANVEILALLGSSAINATGNGLNNTIVGNSAANIIDGGTGADSMSGGLGADTYYVDNSGDVVVEPAGTDRDRVYSSVSYALSANVEILLLTGTSAINGTGNGLANTIIGNSAANVINGGAGADYMAGGYGDDTYYVDNSGDSVVENASAGRDRVYSSISYTLADNVEILALLGTSAINGTGNALGNTLVGNSAANVLAGGGGADVVTGGLGGDTFVFRDGDFAGPTFSPDRIMDFDHAQGDRINLAGVDANTGATFTGDQAFAFIGTAAFHHTAGELRYEIVNGNTFVSGDTNGDGLADFMIRLDGSHALVSGDFVL